MLVTSAVRRSRVSSGSSGSRAPGLQKASSTSGQELAGLQKASDPVEAATVFLRNVFPHGFQENFFHGREEIVGEQHFAFFNSWFGMQTLSVPTARKAWESAFPSLGRSAVNAALTKITGVKNFVLKKKRNAKTGEKMPHWVKTLVATIDAAGLPGGLGKAEKLASSSKQVVAAVPDETPSDLADGLEPSQEVDCISLSSSGPLSPSTQVASLSGNLPEDMVSSGALQKPAASTAGASKRPASALGGLHKAKKKVRQMQKSWKASPSFGFVKDTVASEKSYIVSKKTLDEKPTCLVNVQGSHGVDHAKVVGQLMDILLSESGLTKAMVVAKKNELLKTGK